MKGLRINKFYRVGRVSYPASKWGRQNLQVVMFHLSGKNPDLRFVLPADKKLFEK